MAPYDGGLSIGSTFKYIHQIAEVPKAISEGLKPYLGGEYSENEIMNTLMQHQSNLVINTVSDSDVYPFTTRGSIIALFKEGWMRAKSSRPSLNNSRCKA